MIVEEMKRKERSWTTEGEMGGLRRDLTENPEVCRYRKMVGSMELKK